MARLSDVLLFTCSRPTLEFEKKSENIFVKTLPHIFRLLCPQNGDRVLDVKSVFGGYSNVYKCGFHSYRCQWQPGSFSPLTDYTEA